MSMDVELLVRGDVITMAAAEDEPSVIRDGAVAISGATISAVGNFAALRAASPDARVVGGRDALVTPGYINAHQHLTGDRLVHSCIPDAIDSNDAIFEWAVPIHAAHTGDDDELSATLAALGALTNGVTCTVEAGTVAHPDRVAAAVERIGMRARIGQWGWDVEGAPFAAPAKEVLERQRAWIESRPRGGLVEPGVTLVGHDLMSDELVGGASDLARDLGVRLTFHMSPSRSDAVSYLERTGRRPLAHLDWIGALGEHVIVAHGVHLDDEEIDIVLRTRTAIASCPWAYLRLAQGFVNGARHDELLRRGGRVGLGCDAENAGDAVDILRAATLFVGLARDRTEDAFSFTARDALALATISGAEAIGKAHELGSLEPGKQADIVVHGTDGPQFLPRGTDPTRQLIWASDGRSVTDVIVAGREIIRDRTCLTIDVDALRDEARQRRDFLLTHRGNGGPGH